MCIYQYHKGERGMVTKQLVLQHSTELTHKGENVLINSWNADEGIHGWIPLRKARRVQDKHEYCVLYTALSASSLNLLYFK